MVEPLADPDDLEERLRFLGPNQDQWNLEDRLQKATNEMDTLVGRTVEEELRPTRSDQTDFSFAFSNIHELVRVEGLFSGEEEKVSNSDFTETLKPTRSDPTNISFDTAWAEDNLHGNDYRLRAIYIPELFKNLELAIAELDITRLASIQTGDEEVKAMAEQAQNRVGNIQKNINRVTSNLHDKDSGDSLAANFNFPGDR